MSTLPAVTIGEAADGVGFTALLDEFGDEIRLERAVYIVTAEVSDELVSKLRENGLLYRSNVMLAVVAPPDESDGGELPATPAVPAAPATPENPERLKHAALLDYLKNETKIKVLEDML
jgi:hypothetical protein